MKDISTETRLATQPVDVYELNMTYQGRLPVWLSQWPKYLVNQQLSEDTYATCWLSKGHRTFSFIFINRNIPGSYAINHTNVKLTSTGTFTDSEPLPENTYYGDALRVDLILQVGVAPMATFYVSQTPPFTEM